MNDRPTANWSGMNPDYAPYSLCRQATSYFHADVFHFSCSICEINESADLMAVKLSPKGDTGDSRRSRAETISRPRALVAQVSSCKATSRGELT